MSKKGNDVLDKIVELGLHQCREQSNLYMEHLNNKYSFLSKMYESKLREEPLSIFKKSHKKWEDELHDIENKMNDTLKSMDEEFECICDINDALGTKKQPSEC